jgi:hypothetical protein
MWTTEYLGFLGRKMYQLGTYSSIFDRNDDAILIPQKKAWRYFVCSGNMVTDAMMLTQALLLIYRVQASLKKRLVFAGIFLPRVL